MVSESRGMPRDLRDLFCSFVLGKGNTQLEKDELEGQETI